MKMAPATKEAVTPVAISSSRLVQQRKEMRTMAGAGGRLKSKRGDEERFADLRQRNVPEQQ